MPPTTLVPPIALIEDDPNDQYFVCRALDDAGIGNPVIICPSVGHARAQFADSATLPQANIPTLFIIDVFLSGRETGIDFLRWLRTQPFPFGATPTMMLTGSEAPEHRAESLDLGAIHFLRKPASDQLLVQAVQALGYVMVTPADGRVSRYIQRVLEPGRP